MELGGRAERGEGEVGEVGLPSPGIFLLRLRRIVDPLQVSNLTAPFVGFLDEHLVSLQPFKSDERWTARLLHYHQLPLTGCPAGHHPAVLVVLGSREIECILFFKYL